MMVFFDTNILIYALCKNVDDIEQQNLSVKLFEKSILKQNLILSDLILCEFVFISKKLKEDIKNIEENLKYLSKFVLKTNFNISNRLVEILNQTKFYNNSFNIFHLAFCEKNNCKLITFDKGFKKLQNISKIEIKIY